MKIDDFEVRQAQECENVGNPQTFRYFIERNFDFSKSWISNEKSFAGRDSLRGRATSSSVCSFFFLWHGCIQQLYDWLFKGFSTPPFKPVNYLLTLCYVELSFLVECICSNPRVWTGEKNIMVDNHSDKQYDGKFVRKRTKLVKKKKKRGRILVRSDWGARVMEWARMRRKKRAEWPQERKMLVCSRAAYFDLSLIISSCDDIPLCWL